MGVYCWSFSYNNSQYTFMSKRLASCYFCSFSGEIPKPKNWQPIWKDHLDGHKLTTESATLDKSDWESRFDKEFPFGSFAGCCTNAMEVKDFIRKEFL